MVIFSWLSNNRSDEVINEYGIKSRRFYIVARWDDYLKMASLTKHYNVAGQS